MKRKKNLFLYVMTFGVALALALPAIAHSWYMQFADTSDNVGQYSSLAMEPGDDFKPHVSYYDATNGDLKYVKYVLGHWSPYIETVASTGNVGQYSSIALDSNNNPHISYYDATNGDLKYARKSGGVWSRVTVDSVGNVGLYTSIALDFNNNPHISYYDATNGNLKYARKSAGVWSKTTVDSTGNVGWFTSLALDASNNPHISYYDVTNGNLRYARFFTSGTLAGWLTHTVDSTGDVGQATSLALDSIGNPHISYVDVTNGYIKYAKKSSGVWSKEIVDPLGIGFFGPLGHDTSIALDSSNRPRISYYDWMDGNLKYAERESSVWLIETADDDVFVGMHNSLALDSDGNPRISYYDLSNGELRFVWGS